MDQDPRFGGIARLYGQHSFERLRHARVCVIGIGGVGTWTVEALARTGIGHLTLVDLDEICVTNTNRQLHTLDGEVGKAKVQVMAERVARINPDCVVTQALEFFTAKSADRLFADVLTGHDLIVDAIDSARQKALLIARCVAEKLPIVTVGSAGGRRDPGAIGRSDLTATVKDPLLREVRRYLRREHGFPHDGPWGIPAVYSREPARYPDGEGGTCDSPVDGSLRIDCASGFGTAAMVTGTVGLFAAASAVDVLLEQPRHAQS
ncbi:MAG: ThiF family adenylyltransferase [Bradymonadia bacterium]